MRSSSPARNHQKTNPNGQLEGDVSQLNTLPGPSGREASRDNRVLKTIAERAARCGGRRNIVVAPWRNTISRHLRASDRCETLWYNVRAKRACRIKMSPICHIVGRRSSVRRERHISAEKKALFEQCGFRISGGCGDTITNRRHDNRPLRRVKLSRIDRGRYL